MSDRNTSGACGCGFGSIIAVMLSAALNGSFWWGVLHLFCGWFYVVYAVIFRFHDIKELFK